MKVTKEMVESWITDGSASAIQIAKAAAEKIAAQMTAELTTNKSGTSSNTIRLSITLKLDGNTRQAKILGSYGFTTPNLGDEAPEIVRDIPDPNQGELTFDATTENPDDAPVMPPDENPEETE